MRNIVQDEGSRTFIEGPVQYAQINSVYQERVADRAPYSADLTNRYEQESDTKDLDIPYHEANDRLD